jgi:hypothetical protein
MHRLSANVTLFLRLFLPTFWVIFFGALTLAFLFADYQGSPFMQTGVFKMLVVIFYLLGIGAFFLTFWKLRRVELDEHFVYITDFFRTARYPFHNIELIHTASYPFVQLAYITLYEKGIFGKKIYFIHKKEAFERIILQHPELMGKVVLEDV